MLTIPSGFDLRVWSVFLYFFPFFFLVLGAETKQKKFTHYFQIHFVYEQQGGKVESDRVGSGGPLAIYVIDVSSDKFKAFAANKTERIEFLGSGL